MAKKARRMAKVLGGEGGRGRVGGRAGLGWAGGDGFLKEKKSKTEGNGPFKYVTSTTRERAGLARKFIHHDGRIRLWGYGLTPTTSHT